MTICIAGKNRCAHEAIAFAMESGYQVVHLHEEPLSGMADEIRKFLNKKDATLLSYIPMVMNDNMNNKKRQDIANLSLNELFQNYYKLKYENEQIPTDLLASFNQIIEEINHEDS